MVQQEKQKEERRPLASVGEKCGVGPDLCLCVLGRRPAGPSCLFFLNPCLQEETFCYKPSISRPPAGKKAHLFGISLSSSLPASSPAAAACRGGKGLVPNEYFIPGNLTLAQSPPLPRMARCQSGPSSFFSVASPEPQPCPIIGAKSAHKYPP